MPQALIRPLSDHRAGPCVACADVSSDGERTVGLHNGGMDVSEKALRMLEHMRGQILGEPARAVEVRPAAISAGVAPEGSECAALVEELLRAGYVRRYPSPSLTAHGFYRLNDSGIAAADGVDNRASLRKAPKGPRITRPDRDSGGAGDVEGGRLAMAHRT